MDGTDRSTFADALGGDGRDSPVRQLKHLLRSIRRHLGMDVAFVSEFRDGRRYFRAVDSAHAEPPVRVGNSDPLEATYCQRVVDGRLPLIIADARQNAVALELPVTEALPVGAHISVPVVLSDGRVYGTFCCFSATADLSLGERDLGAMRAFADLAARRIEGELNELRARTDLEERVRAVLTGDALSMVYQPIRNVAQDRLVGFEALARFAAEPKRTPDIWFADAARAGLGARLEIEALRRALPCLAHFPEDLYVSVNLSPATLLDDALGNALADVPPGRLMVEITEHAAVKHYADIADAVGRLRARGVRVAIDDVGAGFSTFRHILNLAPDVIKLDISITRGIDADRSRRALALALVGFAQATGSKLVAEGVETEAELATLRALGVNKAQGYLIGRPAPLDEAKRAYCP
jgi:EAL domain-containing protein (putative c-di-GMP-specific phosphodiesterase class I)